MEAAPGTMTLSGAACPGAAARPSSRCMKDLPWPPPPRCARRRADPPSSSLTTPRWHAAASDASPATERQPANDRPGSTSACSSPCRHAPEAPRPAPDRPHRRRRARASMPTAGRVDCRERAQVRRRRRLVESSDLDIFLAPKRGFSTNAATAPPPGATTSARRAPGRSRRDELPLHHKAKRAAPRM